MRACSIIAATLVLGMAAQTASAQSRISIAVAGEAYGGAPTFQIKMGDRIIGEGLAEKAIDTELEGRLFGAAALDAYIENFEFEIDDAVFDPTAPIRIVLTNDRYADIGDGYDRNLFISTVIVNGVERVGREIKIVEYGVVEVDVPLHEGLRPLYGSGQVAVAAPPADGWPIGATEVAAVPFPIPRPADK